MAQAHLFVDDLDAPVVADHDRHHVERVLRVRVGEEISVSDGQGGYRSCRLAAGGRLHPDGDVVREPAPAPSIGVGFALVKGGKPEWIVSKLTECGVDRILPFVAERSVVRWDDAKAARNLGRLQRVAVEAAMQSRRTWLPVVEAVRTFAQVAPGSWLADGGLDAPGPSLGREAALTVLIGPEGGWSPAERAEAGGRLVRFVPTVLRAETAAVAAGVLLAALRAGTVVPADGRVARS